MSSIRHIVLGNVEVSDIEYCIYSELWYCLISGEVAILVKDKIWFNEHFGEVIGIRLGEFDVTGDKYMQLIIRECNFEEYGGWLENGF